MEKALALKVQIYKSEKKQGGGPSKTQFVKHYIYSKSVYDRGGLWANLRDLSQAEIARNTQVDIVNTAELVLNYNSKLAINANGLWVEYMDNRTNVKITYKIHGDADLFDHITRRIKMQLEERTDNSIYSGVIYDN